MNLKKCTILIVPLIVVIFSSLFLMGSFYDNPQKENVSENNEDTLNSQKTTLAVMKEATKGKGDYQETTVNKFSDLKATHLYVKEKSGCVDGDGKTIDGALTFNETSWQVSITADSSAYCFLYFKLK